MVFDPRTKELIGIGAAFGANCMRCLRYHFKEAVKAGCTIEEIHAAVDLAKIIKENPAKDISELAERLIAKAKEK